MKCWTEARAALAVVCSALSIISGTIAYIQIDTTSFTDTTNIVSVSANGHLYTKIKTNTELPEMSYVIVSINNNQVDQRIYPEGIKRGEIIIDTPLPFTAVDDDLLDVTVDIYFMGVRTLFQPERLSVQLKVKQENNNVQSNNSKFIIDVPVRSGVWI